MRIRRFIVALVLGTMLNVLVAFLCLCYSPTVQTSSVALRGIGGEDGVGVADNTLVVKPSYRDRGFGVMIVGVMHFWVMPRNTPDQRYPQLHGVAVETTLIGWPFTAFQSGHFDMAGANDHARFNALATQAVSRPSTYSTGLVYGINAEPRLLPDRVAPVGFAVNTLLYSTAVFALWVGLLRLRALLRRRAGRCGRCKYPVRGLDRCPECGLDAPPPSTTATTATPRSHQTPPTPPPTPLSAPSAFLPAPLSAASASPSAPSAFRISPSPGAPQ